MTRVLPLSENGAASAVPLPGGIEDRTEWPRFGLKGPGTQEWCASQGIFLPSVNECAEGDGLRICRLGAQDVLWLGLDPDGAAIANLRQLWEKAPRGYSSWREEAWAWLYLDQTASQVALPRLTAIDLRASAFPPAALLQTRIAHQDAVLMHGAGGGTQLFFDVSATAQVVLDLTHALCAGGLAAS